MPYHIPSFVLHENYKDHYGDDFVADLVMFGESDNSLTGYMGGAAGKINEVTEMIILFKWDGDGNHPIRDIDYFLWGNNQNAIDKSNIPGYQSDTSVDDQLYFKTVAGQYYAYSRIGTDEVDEIQTGGNGINGHNETSENFRESWEIIPLFNIGCMDPNAYNYNPEAVVNDHNCITATLESIINGEHNSRIVTVEGLIVDYFDITIFNGPHSLTIIPWQNLK